MSTQDCNIPNIVINPAYKLASKISETHRSIVDVNGVKIGGNALAIIAGPCAVESKEQLLGTAKLVETYGAQILRGGAFKPRTSPYSFQGLEEEGLKLLKQARIAT